MKTKSLPFLLCFNALFVLLSPARCVEAGAADSGKVKKYEAPALIAPAKSLGTGLPYLPDLDLSKFSRADFIEATSTVGTNRIGKTWTNAIVSLPPHSRPDPHGLTEEEVKAYMAQARDLFDDGKAIPMSDVGLISTQEDVIRQPMLNHISAFSNSVARVYLLVQKTLSGKGWGYFSIVEDMTVNPPMDYFADMNGRRIRFEKKECYKCHSSGPLAIHPAREDLVIDAALAAAISKHIAKQPLADFYLPPNEQKIDYGKPMTLEFCTKCHDTDGIRQPLYRVHSHPIRILADYGYMPPKHPLKTNEVAELKAWLEEKPGKTVEAKE